MRYNKRLAGKIYTYFTTKANLKPYRRGWLKGNCPECGAIDKFGVNVGQNRTNCFKCGYNPKPLNVISNIEGHQEYSETHAFLGAFEESTNFYEEQVEILQQSKRFKLPESYRLITLGDSDFSKICRYNLKKRGFNLNELALKGVGYCVKGEFSFRIIIPYYINGKLVYFNARKVIGDDTSKFKNPPIDEVGIGKSLLIYNRDCLWVYKKVYMVESATNALTLGDRAFGIGGKVLSDSQLGEILKSPCEEVVIILDPDAWSWAIKAALKLVGHKKVRLILLPDDLDVNNIGKKATLKLVKESKLLKYTDIIKLKHEAS